MGRIGDAARTLLKPSWDDQLLRSAAELERQKSEVRTLTAELADNLEKFHALLAREAKRRIREQKKMMEPEEEKPAVVEAAPPPEPSSKADLWRRALALHGRKPQTEAGHQ